MAESVGTRRRQRWAERENQRRQADYQLRFERFDPTTTQHYSALNEAEGQTPSSGTTPLQALPRSIAAGRPVG
jgi:hypothetical protein